MAHVISITDGTTTITFSAASGYQVEEYDPRVAENERGVRAATIAETLQIYITGSSGAQVQTRLAALERLLLAVTNRALTGVGPRVYLQLQLDSDAQTWRSELVDARLEPAEQALRLWPNNLASFQFFILRESFWEGALTQLPLTNGNGTNNTSGLTVYNHDDSGAGHDNYVQVAAASVAGTIPAPVMLELTNTTGSTQSYVIVYMATNAFCDPVNFTHILEAEAAAVSGTYESVGSNADSSNGQYTATTITGTYQAYLDLSAALLAKSAGHDFHLLARYRSAFVAYITPSIWTANSGVKLRTGDAVESPLISPALIDLGVISLPPGGYSASYGAGRLGLHYRVTGTATVHLDYIALFPAVAFRRLDLVGSVANGGKIVDDPIEDRAYVSVSGAETPQVVRRSSPVMVWPNTLQRIFILWEISDYSAPIAQTFTVKAWYRPRRVSF